MRNFLIGASLFLFASVKCESQAAQTGNQTPKQDQAKPNPKPKDPVVIFLNGKNIKLSEIMPYLVNLTGGNFSGMGKEQLTNAIDMARKMYVMQVLLEQEAAKKDYEKDAKHKSAFDKAKKSTAINIYMQELGKTFSDAKIKEEYNKYAGSSKLSDYSFKLIVVQDENTAKLIKSSLDNGVDFGKLAKEKSMHGSADRESNPGLIDFIREDYISRAFGGDFIKGIASMRTNEVKVLRLPDGKYSIIKFVNKRRSAPLSLNEVKPRLIMDLTNAKLIAMTDAMLTTGNIAFYSLDGKKEPVSKLTPTKQASSPKAQTK